MLTANLDPQLQLERVLAANEQLYQKWRHHPPQSQPTNTLIFAEPEPLTAAEQAHVREVVAGTAAGLGANSNTLADVLDALGVLPARPAAQVIDLKPRRKYGQCRTCGRSSIAIRRDGTLTSHAPRYDQRIADARCPGSGLQPIKKRSAA